MSEVFAILDKEKEYLEQIMHYLKQKKGFNFIVVAFTEISTYLEYEETNPVALLLYHYSNEEVIGQCKAKQKIALVESKLSLHENEKRVFKYQSAEILISEILKYYEGPQRLYTSKTKGSNLLIIGIFTLMNEVNTSCFGASLAYEYGKLKKILYISFDPFFNYKMFGLRDEIDGVSELIYLVKQKSNNLYLKINSILKKVETFDCIAGFTHWDDLYEVQEAEVNELLNTIRNTLEYELLIVDMGSINHLSIAFMEQCDCIYQTIQNDEVYGEREKEYRRQILLKKKDIINKIKSVTTPNFSCDATMSKILKDGKTNQFVKELITKEALFND